MSQTEQTTEVDPDQKSNPETPASAQPESKGAPPPRDAEAMRQAVRRASQKKGLVIVNTGKGKGKTTAALGMLLRAWGRGMKVCMLSFIKSETSNYGEERAARKLGVELIPLGGGFTWLSKDIEHDKALALSPSTAAK